MNRQLMAKRNVANSITTTLSVSDLDAGTYMIRINTSNGTTYKKLIVK